ELERAQDRGVGGAGASALASCDAAEGTAQGERVALGACASEAGREIAARFAERFAPEQACVGHHERRSEAREQRTKTVEGRAEERRRRRESARGPPPVEGAADHAAFGHHDGENAA